MANHLEWDAWRLPQYATFIQVKFLVLFVNVRLRQRSVFPFMLGAIMLNVIILSMVMLSVMALGRVIVTIVTKMTN